MLNEIVNAIGLKLSENFEGIDVHREELEQGFKEPCFFIDLLNPSEKQIVGNRYLRSYLFDITYFPKDKKAQDIFETLDKLYTVLEYIKLDDGTLVRGTQGKRTKYCISLLRMKCSFTNWMEKKQKWENLE